MEERCFVSEIREDISHVLSTLEHLNNENKLEIEMVNK